MPNLVGGFKSRQPRCLLVVDTGYFLVRELISALRAEGHRVVRILLQLSEDRIKPNPGEYSRFLRSIVEAAASCKPDALVTVNHLGFDREGRLTEFLDKIQLPVLVWYVDSPRYILMNYLGNISDRVGIFLWDRSYLPWMKKIGCEKVHCLALATDPLVFRPLQAQLGGERFDTDSRMKTSDSLVFVGDSMTTAVREAVAKLPLHLSSVLNRQPGDIRTITDVLAHRLCNAVVSTRSNGRIPVWDSVAEVLDASNLAAKLFDEVERLNLESALVLAATRKLRNGFLEALIKLHRTREATKSPLTRLTVFGDEGWKDVLNGSCRILPPVDYYRDLPQVYQNAGAVINLTGLQMPHALNQRCYDVPAAGGFLLTDDQPALNQQFEIGKEIIAFRSPEELVDKWEFFNRYGRERSKIIENGRRRILSEHTYRHRVREMLKMAESWFA